MWKKLYIGEKKITEYYNRFLLETFQTMYQENFGPQLYGHSRQGRDHDHSKTIWLAIPLTFISEVKTQLFPIDLKSPQCFKNKSY